jgi:hypothetical protein
MRQGLRVSVGLVLATRAVLAAGALPAAAVPATTTVAASTAVVRASGDSDENTLRVRTMPADSPNLRDLAPGDRTQWAAEVTNTGAPGTLGVEFVAYGDDGLLTGEGTGLRMTVDLCMTPLVVALSANGATTFECASGQKRLAAVTSAVDQRVVTRSTVGTGETVAVRVIIAFPPTAGNASESAAAAMDVVFSITPDGGSTSAPASSGSSDSPSKSTTPVDPGDSLLTRPVFPGGLALTGISVMFLGLAAAAIISLGVLLLSLAPRRTSARGDKQS